MNKKTIIKWMVLPMSLMTAACTDYQSSIDELSIRVDDIDQRVTRLEGLNHDIDAIKQIVEAQEQAGYIAAVTQTAEGYQFSMSNGKVISVRDGQDGKNGVNGQDGHTPIIGVAQDGDSNWYWTVDGQFLLDGMNNKVRANGIDGKDGLNGQDGQNGQNGQNGQDGVSPQIRVNTGTQMWEVSYDNGATWTSLGVKAVGQDGQDGQNGQNGQNGQDGISPQLRVNTETQMWEVSYDNGATWTSLGVKAVGQDGQDGQNGQNGQDGVTPQLRINTGSMMWEVSLDNGVTWTSLEIRAQGDKGDKGDKGDAFFKSVVVGEDEVTFTLADGVTTFTLPLMDTFKKVRDRVQSIVFIPENIDGMMKLQNGVQTTLRYRVMPEAVATALATDYAGTLSFIGEEVALTRGAASATIAINGVVNEGNGRLALTVTPSGMTAEQGYAFALVMNDGTSMYSTAYTSVYHAIPPVAIGIAAEGTLAGKGNVSVGSTVQLIALLVPADTNLKGVKWTSSDTSVAKVNDNGLVTACNNGTAVVTVTSTADPTVKKSITVTVSDGSITLNTDELVSQSDAE